MLKTVFVIAAIASIIVAFTKSGKDQAVFVMVGVVDLIIAGSC